jgi:hypothetical protein
VLKNGKKGTKQPNSDTQNTKFSSEVFHVGSTS